MEVDFGELIRAGRRAEHETLRAEKPSSLQQLRETPLRLERNAPRLRVLGVFGRDDDLMRIPEHVPILDLQHFAQPATSFECSL
jgi:hypothetical protein